MAGILADYKFDSKTIITALLHDVVEDTSRDLKDIKVNFGNEISYLVDGVTKLSKFEGDPQNLTKQKTLESYYWLHLRI